MPLYLYILIGSVIVPLLYSTFIKDFIKHWKNFFISTTIIAIIFLIWDALFTYFGIWSFNPDYCLNFSILRMPIEEWIFFYIIPFCSLFIHFVLIGTFPHLSLSKNFTHSISAILISITIIILATNLSKAYTSISSVFLLITIIIGFIYQRKLLQQFYISFLIILIPFFIVNGILTGVATPSPVVIYNDLENIGVRILTIPVEDVGYAFTMLFGNLMIFESLKNKLHQ